MIIRNTNQIKVFNTHVVRGALTPRTPLTIGRIVRSTHLSVPTVTRIVDEMVESRELLIYPEEVITGGRRARQYVLNADFAYTLCIYFERKVIWTELTNVIGDVTDRGEVAVEELSHVGEIDRIVAGYAAKYPALKAVSIGVPAWVDRDRLKAIKAYPSFTDVNFRELIQQKYQLPCHVTNDLKAIVRGYYNTHFAGQKTSLCCFHLSSSGPGTGLIVDGKLLPGFVGFAGEVGYLPVGSTTLHQALGPDSDEKSRVRAAAAAVAALITLINPQYFLFCTHGRRLGPVKKIIDLCREKLPAEALPQFIESEEYHLYYLKGLRQIGRDMIFGPVV